MLNYPRLLEALMLHYGGILLVAMVGYLYRVGNIFSLKLDTVVSVCFFFFCILLKFVPIRLLKFVKVLFSLGWTLISESSVIRMRR